ncbi:MAG TPA: hypothetical protein VN380_06830 [Thermoanaerobaculia bacterium]|jgi:hypothetical protein|nr:hypothetical protein [Thermoanaerobaculia bacterium]
MAKAKSANAELSAAKAALKGKISGPCLEAVAQMAAEGRNVQVVGRVRNGKVEFDQESLTTFARKFPNANMTFVAVNAPFDPVQSTDL